MHDFLVNLLAKLYLAGLVVVPLAIGGLGYWVYKHFRPSAIGSHEWMPEQDRWEAQNNDRQYAQRVETRAAITGVVVFVFAMMLAIFFEENGHAILREAGRLRRLED